VHVYDHDYIRRGSAVYSSGAFNRASWDRYLVAFDTVLVVANERIDPAADVATLNRVDRAGVEFRFLPKERSLRGLAAGLFGLHRQLSELVRGADAVAVRLTSELGYQAAGLARRHDTPLAVEVVDCPWDAYRAHSVRGRLFAPLAWWRMRRALARTSFAIYVTERFLQRRYPTRGLAAAASNVVLADVPATSTDRPVERQADSSPADGEDDDDILRIGLVGNLDVKVKGHRILLEAFASVADRFPTARLVFVGGGDASALDALARQLGLEGRVDMPGRVSAGEPMMHCLDALDLYVHPSFKEGLPRAVIEAMGRGRAVLASRAGGTDELLPAERLHRPGDVRGLAGQLAGLLGDAALRERLGRENLAVAERFRPTALDARRHAFWRAFAAHCAHCKGD